MIISAPTSFGKSLLIEDIVASKKFNNMIIIQPTLALLDETRQKLFKYQDAYKIIVKTTQAYSQEKGNIFLLTAERVLEYSNLPYIDFLVIDEFYKLSAKRDDERSDILNNAFYLITKRYNSQFLLLGPNISEISQGFTDAYNAEFYRTDYSLVNNVEVDYYSKYMGKFGKRGVKKEFKEKTLFGLLETLGEEQTIIFCSSPTRARYLAKKFMDFLKQQGMLAQPSLPLVDWINNNIHKEWSLAKCLNYRIGVHDGALPRHITSSIIKYFNDGQLRYLFCTTTIIEGVNTSAKNIIYFDDLKGKDIPIDYFDYSNIKGRAGRMMIHYVGKIYNFNPPPPKKDIIVDIPFFEQNPISDEILINLDDDEILNPSSEQSNYIKTMRQDIRKIVQKNGINVRGQIEILKALNNLQDLSIIRWSGFPTYEQLKYVISLAWAHLIKPGENVSPMTANRLVKLTFDYTQKKNIQALIVSNFNYYCTRSNSKHDKHDILDEAIKDAFQTQRHWFQFKVPKWLGVMHTLQEYICTQKGVSPGNYLFYSNLIENEFLPPNLTLLSEYNVPISAIKKLMRFIPDTIGEDDVLNYIYRNNLISKSQLSLYERQFLI